MSYLSGSGASRLRPPTSRTDRSHVETMQDIIEEILARPDVRSARHMDQLATKMGYSLAYTSISAIRNGTHSGKYQTRTLEAIAAVGNMPRKRVYAAAGLPLPGKPFADELPDDVDFLDRPSREAVLGVVRVLLEARSPSRAVTTDPQDTTSRPRPGEAAAPRGARGHAGRPGPGRPPARARVCRR